MSDSDTERKKMGEQRFVAINEEELLDAINEMEQLKPVLQKQLLIANGKNIDQGIKDAKELGKHFDTAIKSMSIIEMMLSGEEDD